ncbi:MAG TPA: DUF6794 domain-containing protein [Polyangia bacterium]|nr:DUF6794 domain-containing protein [Polyangia bacterium]
MLALASLFGAAVWAMPILAAPSELCWQSLPSATPGKEDQSLAETGIVLSATGPNEVWLGWHEYGWTVARWTNGKWSDPPEPACAGMDKVWAPAALAANVDAAFIAFKVAGQPQGSSALRIARVGRTRCDWLGEPLMAGRADYTHLQDVDMAIAGGQPVVVWSEEVGVHLGGLFAARWDGTAWKRLGMLQPRGDDYFLKPTVRSNGKGEVWVAWTEGGYAGTGRALRVARWAGTSWSDVGEKSLSEIVAQNGGQASTSSLAVDATGHAWVGWIAPVLELGRRRGRRLALARWGGATWGYVSPPRGPAGKDGTLVGTPRIVLRNGSPIIAWSQADETENDHLFVAEWAGDARWERRLSAMHLVAGVSRVLELRLEAGDSNAIFVAWDERGDDDRRTRLIRAYDCPQGETPAAPPKAVVPRDTWPTTVDEAARQIIGRLDEKSKDRLRKDEKKNLIRYHLGWGMGIRNSFGLWQGNTKLLESCGGGKPIHPDDCSMIIIEAVWARVHGTDGGVP